MGLSGARCGRSPRPALAALLTALSVAGCAPAPSGPPDILLITVDTLRADALGAYGGPPTPAVDDLAERGLRYTRAYAVTPLTIPSHAALFTGRYPPRSGVRDNGDYSLSESAVTLAERLSAAGYRTAASVGAYVTSARWGFGQGFDTYLEPRAEAGADSRWAAERRGDAVVDDALAWLADRGEEPWFLWVHLFDPHHPYRAPAGYGEGLSAYAAEVAYVDAQLARLLDEVGPEVLVVLAGDHGEGLGEHGEDRHGVLLYEATTRVPLILRPPGGRAGVIDVPVSLVDVAPTLLAAAGAEGVDGDGVDLGLLGDRPPDRGIYLESRYAWHRYGWAPQYGLVTGDYKLIASSTPELYAAADRAEARDLAGDRPALLGQLTEQLRALRQSLEDAGAAAEQVRGIDGEARSRLEALGYVAAPDRGEPEPSERPPDPAARIGSLDAIGRADRALRDGRPELAVAILEPMLAEDPGMVEPRVALARALRALGRQEEALEVAERADALRPLSTTRATLGRLYLDLGQTERGLAMLESSIALDPYRENTWQALLMALFLRGRFEEVAAAVERAREVLPESLIVRSMAAHLALIRGDPGGEEVLRAVLAQDPELPLANYGLAVAAHRRGDLEEAEARLRRELALYPEATHARRLLVGICLDTGRPGEARALAADCLERMPRSPGCRRLAAAVAAE